MKKEASISPFEQYQRTLSADSRRLLQDFLQEYAAHIRLGRHEQQEMLSDVQEALLYYAREKVPLHEALSRLAPENLGGFYARPPVAWYALDSAAKIYPLAMKHGRMAVFRLSVTFHQSVVPALLQMALTFTIKRFPSFATTLKRGFFWHYLDASKRRYCIEGESSIPCQPLPVYRSGSQSFRVLYYQRRVSVEFFHALTDGTGGLTFLKTLTAEYLRLLGEELPGDDQLWRANDTPDAEETADMFARIPAAGRADGFIDKPAVQMSGTISRRTPDYVLHFRMNAAHLKAAAARHHGTVTAYMLSQLFLAGKAATDHATGEVSIQVPVNMRKFYPSPTVRNFSLYCGVRLPLQSIADTDSLIAEISRQLQEKASKEAMDQMATSAKRLVHALRFIPLFIKLPIAGLIYGLLSDIIFSNTLSNLGVVTMPPALMQHIACMDFTLGTAISNRAGCTLLTFGGISTLTITKMTGDPSFEEKLCALLEADGVSVHAEGSCRHES